MDKVLILASVPSMIGQFNMPNINILQDIGYEVHVACNFKDTSFWTEERISAFIKQLQKQKIIYHQVNFSRNIFDMYYHYKSYRKVLELTRIYKFKIIHCHTPIAGVIGRLAVIKSKTKVIYTAHGFHFYKGAPILNWFVYYPVEKYLAKYTDLLITINNEDYILAKKKMKAKKVVYIPGIGIDTSKFKEMHVDKVSKKKEIGVPENAIWLLTVGELSKRKNHESLIQAIAKIENIFCTIAGKGELQEHLIKIIGELKVEDRVKLLGYRNDVGELCSASDVFVLPSLQEGLPVALMEAMASGKPVACSNIRGNTDLIEEGKGGVFFEPLNVKDIERALRRLILCDMSEMGNYNLRTIKKYDAKKVLNQYYNLYENL